MNDPELNLYFRNSDGCDRLVAVGVREENAVSATLNALNEINPKYVSYYQRTWWENGELWIDVGSHTEFFILKEESK